MRGRRDIESAIAILDGFVKGRGSADRLTKFAERLARVRTTFAALAAENASLREENELLREKETHFRELFDATYDGIFLVDIERQRIVDANETASRLVGYSRDELRELSIADLHPYELPRLLDFAREVLRHGKWQSHDLTCRAKWGELIPAEFSATAVVYDGRPCLLVLVHDMREHRLAELGLAVSKIGHDLRNILATTQLLSDRLAPSRDPEIRHIAPRIVKSIDRAIALCAETLAHGRARQPPPRYSTCALRPLVEDVATTASVGPDPGVAWHNEVPTDFALRVDPDQLFRVLLNLVRNARKALEGERGGEIRVLAARERDTVSIDIADTGPGIPEAVRERMFEPFASYGRPDSTGLGLVIARELMRGHGGDLHLLSSGSRGTVFRLELPQG